MSKLKCCTSPPSNPWGRVCPPPSLGLGVEETYDISDYSKGDIEKEEGNSFSILHLACMSSLLYFAGDRSLAVFVVFFFGIITQVLNLGNRIMDETLITDQPTKRLTY